MKYSILIALLFSSYAEASRFIVEAHRPLENLRIKNLKVEPFGFKKHSYFSKLYSVSGNITDKELLKFNWVKKIEPAVELSKFTLIPADKSLRPVQDELFVYQWGLFNQGQTYIREKDDIHNLPMVGVLNKDIGWRKLLSNLPKERPVVAVLDSGVDLSHPELQGNLWKNTDECGKDSKMDNDGNKLKGDCHGWNFTEAIDSEDAKNPNDNDGHGTHIAGIIAAQNDNRGIVGVLPEALIMPVKVMKDSDSNSEIASSESFARGIIYAVDNGAQVINMSLGWPRSLETKYLREAVYYAINSGVIIVAAAGNNNSSEPLFPCAYEGVLCVGATTLDGSIASFSNYGGHVDTLAPGEGILSLNPILYEPEIFSVPGYEIRSGTSQSAPFVTALVAALKVQDQNLNLDDVFAKFYQLKGNLESDKYTLGGNAVWENLAKVVNTPVIRPVLKRVRQIVIKGESSISKLIIPVRNYGVLADNIRVTLESLSSSIEIISGEQLITNLEKSQTRDVSFDLKVNDFGSESIVKIKVNIEVGNEKNSFVNEVPVVRDIRGEADLKSLAFKFTGAQNALGIIRNNEVVSLLTTMDSVKSGTHELFMKRTIQNAKEKSLEIRIFKRVEDKFQEAPKAFTIANAVGMVNLIRVDLNFDGHEDYLVHTIIEKDNKKSLQFSFYNSAMEALWPSFQDITVENDVFIESMNDLSFVELKDKKLGRILVPAFFTIGQIPKVDQVLSNWDRQDFQKKKRLYYLSPTDEKTFKIRTLLTNTWAEKIKKVLNSKWYETVEMEQQLPRSEADIESGSVRVLVSIGMATKRQLFIYRFNSEEIEHGKVLPQLVLQSEEVDPMLSLSPEGLKISGDVYFNIYDRVRSKIVTTKDLSQDNQFIYRLESEADVIAGHLFSFELGDERVSIVQTREELISIRKGTETKISSRPKLRYSFLSHKLLSELYTPVVFNRSGEQGIALYVDSTAVTGNRVYLFELQNEKLVASIKNSLLLPGVCKALNPQFSKIENSHEFVFLCLEEKNWVIKTFQMK